MLSFALRLLYILLIDAEPFSDFQIIYNCGQKFALGDYSVFKGTSYIGRFSHLTILTIYFGMIIKVFPNPILVIKLINIILSTINVYIIYWISIELYEDKKRAIMISFIACTFPPFIFYNSVLCSENLAMTFFIGSIYLFLLVIKGKKGLRWIIASGLLLSIGNLFRMVGIVILIAYIFYLIICHENKKCIKMSILLIVSFLSPWITVNSILLKLNITEYPLWHGREPAITSVLKGTNIQSLGMWNKEDSQISEKYKFNYDKVQSVCELIIKKRLISTPLYKLIGFYIIKFIAQWSSGDFSGAYWSTGNLSILNSRFNLSTVLFFYSQLVYLILMIYVYIQLFNIKQYLDNKLISLLYIIFCGFGLFYLIIEQQPRYGYIISWVFVLLGNYYPDMKMLIPNIGVCKQKSKK
ncbi:glycosyltransferase family 39 protein [Clostridium hydrogenum]|uniref:glycosyltransferase family 39 protein n=1 Tax=Clostridium hydrogenum TaxID=2855764 RepID=UPI001F1A56C5|nr:glycosyltransferase family 39 protein [Clostridium hydrogenum]